MPHYKDGTEAQVGDFVKFKDYNGKEQVGRLRSISPGSTTCNGTVNYVEVVPTAQVRETSAVTLGDAELVCRPEQSAE